MKPADVLMGVMVNLTCCAFFLLDYVAARYVFGFERTLAVGLGVAGVVAIVLAELERDRAERKGWRG